MRREVWYDMGVMIRISKVNSLDSARRWIGLTYSVFLIMTHRRAFPLPSGAVE